MAFVVFVHSPLKRNSKGNLVNNYRKYSKKTEYQVKSGEAALPSETRTAIYEYEKEIKPN